MSDRNPYQPPGEYNEPFSPTSGDSWPKTAVATIDADWYARAFRVHQRRGMLFIRVFVLFIAGVFVVANGICLLGGDSAPISLDSTTLTGIVVGVGILCFLFATRGARQKRIIRKQLREMGQDRQEVRYEISPDHIRFRTNDSESRFSWDRFLKWKERDGVILLYRSSKFFMIVPVELFEPDAADALRACLRANVTGG